MGGWTPATVIKALQQAGALFILLVAISGALWSTDQRLRDVVDALWALEKVQRQSLALESLKYDQGRAPGAPRAGVGGAR